MNIEQRLRRLEESLISEAGNLRGQELPNLKQRQKNALDLTDLTWESGMRKEFVELTEGGSDVPKGSIQGIYYIGLDSEIDDGGIVVVGYKMNRKWVLNIISEGGHQHRYESRSKEFRSFQFLVLYFKKLTGISHVTFILK